MNNVDIMTKITMLLRVFRRSLFRLPWRKEDFYKKVSHAPITRIGVLFRVHRRIGLLDAK
jgi:hypothetical protein